MSVQTATSLTYTDEYDPNDPDLRELEEVVLGIGAEELARTPHDPSLVRLTDTRDDVSNAVEPPPNGPPSDDAAPAAKPTADSLGNVVEDRVWTMAETGAATMCDYQQLLRLLFAGPSPRQDSLDQEILERQSNAN